MAWSAGRLLICWAPINRSVRGARTHSPGKTGALFVARGDRRRLDRGRRRDAIGALQRVCQEPRSCVPDRGRPARRRRDPRTNRQGLVRTRARRLSFRSAASPARGSWPRSSATRPISHWRRSAGVRTGSGSCRRSSPDAACERRAAGAARVDDLRRQLRALGYLDAGVDRFVLGSARDARRPSTITWLSSVRIGLLAAALLGPAAAIGVAARLPGLITGPRDAVVVASYLDVFFGCAVAASAAVVGLVVAWMSRTAAGRVKPRARLLSIGAGASRHRRVPYIPHALVADGKRGVRSGQRRYGQALRCSSRP